MSVYRVLLTATITDTDVVEADTRDEAKTIAKKRFVPTGEIPQTYEVEATIDEELAPVENTSSPIELCPWHEIPIAVMIGGKMHCPICLEHPYKETE